MIALFDLSIVLLSLTVGLVFSFRAFLLFVHFYRVYSKDSKQATIEMEERAPDFRYFVGVSFWMVVLCVFARHFLANAIK